MYEEDTNQLNYEPNVGMSYGMYVGDGQVTAYDPYASGQATPASYAFYSGIQESRI